jgi:hypothetical protein
MDSSLRLFISEYLGAAAAALTPVFLTAFLSVPYTLMGHPGDERPAAVTAGQHMT